MPVSAAQGMAVHRKRDFTTISGSSNADGEMDIEAKLKKLESLYNQGLISHDEYQKKREEFLKEF